jgi:4'-phosphopantetheinyl transferase
MDVQVVPGWARVAHDYLGMAVACRLAALSDADRPYAFAQAWAELEARLKLHGLPLSEWTSSLDECRVLPLELPAGFAGALAVQG